MCDVEMTIIIFFESFNHLLLVDHTITTTMELSVITFEVSNPSSMEYIIIAASNILLEDSPYSFLQS